jgi:kynureninase
LWSSQINRGFAIGEINNDDGWISAEELCSKIDERVAIVALPLVSPQNGALLPLSEVAAHARRMGAITVVDAYQAVGVVPVDVQALGADVVVGGTHKWMCGGGMGLAFMYVRPALAERLQPMYPGWIGHGDLQASTARFEPAEGARRYQQGSPAMEPIYTARAGIRYLLKVGLESIRTRSLELTTRILEAAQDAKISVLTPASAYCRGGMVCFDIPDPNRVVTTLATEGIDVDFRPGAGLRAGPFPCLDNQECDDLVNRLVSLTRP